jgi:integrase
MTDSGIGRAKCYRLLHAIMESAVRDELIARNPCTIHGAGQEHSPERPSVSVPEVWALAEAVGERWRAVVLLAAFCGLRWGEIAALTRADVDFPHGRITVERDLDELNSGKLQPGRVKSAAGRRTVAIPEVMVPDLKRHIATWARPDGLVFVGLRGGLLRRSTFRRAVWRPARDSIGRPDLHFHDLRGCAATLAAISGATTAELMRRLGHATPGVAMRYQRATADRDAAVAQLMSDLVRPAEPTPHRLIPCEEARTCATLRGRRPRAPAHRAG